MADDKKKKDPREEKQKEHQAEIYRSRLKYLKVLKPVSISDKKCWIRSINSLTGKFEWLKEVDVQALCFTQMDLQSAFSGFFKQPNKGFPKYKSKRHNIINNKNIVTFLVFLVFIYKVLKCFEIW